eukprot:4300609-Heterocapsa_arctica.AAC.1
MRLQPTTGCLACENLPFGVHNARCCKRKAEFELKRQKSKEEKLQDEEEYEELEMEEDANDD